MNIEQRRRIVSAVITSIPVDILLLIEIFFKKRLTRMGEDDVRQLEPNYVFDETSFLLENDNICDKIVKLPAGCIVNVKRKSSDTIYKVKLLTPTKAKSRKSKEKRTCDLDENLDSSSEEVPPAESDIDDADLEDEKDDDAQFSLDVENVSSTSSYQDENEVTVTEKDSEPLENCEMKTVQCDIVKEVKLALKSEMDVMRCEMKKEIIKEIRWEMDAFRKDMELEMDSVKRKCEKENRNSKKVFESLLREVQDNITQQIKSVMDTVSELNDILKSCDKEDDIGEHTPEADGQSAEQEHSSIGIKDGKREKAAFGQVESEHVVKYKDDGKKILSIKCDKYSKMLHSARTPTSFLRKLLRESFTSQTLAKSNYNGGKVTCFNGVIKKKVLDRERVQAIIEQVKLEFPGSLSGFEAEGKLRDAVNEECRQAARKLRLQEKYGT